MLELLGHLGEAFQIAFTPAHFIALVLAVFAGLVMGILPGLTATMSVALLAGLTFGFSPEIAVISLVGVYTGAISGGCQAAVLLNIPGTPASAATALDGHMLSKQGKGGLAIFAATGASMIGTLIGVFFVLFLTPPLSALGLRFQSYEFFLLALFGIMICGTLAGGDPIKGWIAGFIGLLIATVGMDPMSGFVRFGFDYQPLRGGLPLIPLMIAIFGIPEIFKVFVRQKEEVGVMSPYKIGEGVKILGQNKANLARGGIIGTLLGIVPGVGEDIGAWMSYSSAKTFSRGAEKEKFGKGSFAGVIASEAGSNASKTAALIPVLSLAIPGSTSAAVMLAAFFMHGYRPGPLLMGEDPGFITQIAVFFALAAMVMMVLGVLLSKVSVKILMVEKAILLPAIFSLCVIGAFMVRYVLFDVNVMFVFGFFGFLLFYAKLPAAPLLLGIVLGQLAEANLIRSLRLSGGSIMPFFTRPISLIFVIIIALMVLMQFTWFKNLLARKKKTDEANEIDEANKVDEVNK